jgi:predicted Zn-dependent peptidase
MFGRAKVKTLKGGLRLVLFPANGSGTYKINFTFFSGSRDDPPNLPGVAHFVEHALMLGSISHPSPTKVERALAQVSRGRIDGGTGPEDTDYSISGWLKDLEGGIGTLGELVFAPAFNDRDVESERQVILREAIGDYTEGRADFDPDVAARRRLLPNQMVAYNSLGFSDSIRKITPQDLAAFHAGHYRPDNAVLFVVADVSMQKAAAMAKRALQPFLSKRYSTRPPRQRIIAPPPRKSFHGIPTPDDTLDVLMAFLLPKTSCGPRYWARALLLRSLFNSHLTSHIFGEGRRRGLFYDLQGAEYRFCDFSYLTITIDNLPKEAKVLKTVLEFFLERFRSFLARPISRRELARLKDETIFEHLKEQLNTEEEVFEEYVNVLNPHSRQLEPEEQIAAILAASAEDLKTELVEVLGSRRMAIVLRGYQPQKRRRLAGWFLDEMRKIAREHQATPGR